MVSVRHRGPQRYALVAGVLLAGHFACWIPSLSFTSVASATALVATQPIWAALVVRAQGERLPRVAWAGIWLAVLGVALVTGVDVSLSGRHALGDGLALLGGLLAAAYVSAGSIARQALSTTSYTTVCYSLCALVLLAGSAAGGVQLGGFRAHDWWLILALTAGPQLLGHSVFNRVLRTTSATVVSLAILFEVPGAVLLAWAWLGQTPQSLAVPGLLLLVAGIAVVLAAGAWLHREQRVELAD
jgi:drug/metabolite transporter (DMT)-like permease